jgi:hypothetical protein
LTWKESTGKPEGLMVQVLTLSRIAGTAPPHFRVVYDGTYGRETHFGAEQDIRRTLAKAGVSATEVDRLFRLAEKESGHRDHNGSDTD